MYVGGGGGLFNVLIDLRDFTNFTNLHCVMCNIDANRKLQFMAMYNVN